MNLDMDRRQCLYGLGASIGAVAFQTMLAGEEQILLQLPQQLVGWPNFGQYQYSSVINFGGKDTQYCQRREVVKWAKKEAVNYGLLDPQKAVNYRSWACQMGVEQIIYIALN